MVKVKHDRANLIGHSLSHRLHNLGFQLVVLRKVEQGRINLGFSVPLAFAFHLPLQKLNPPSEKVLI